MTTDEKSLSVLLLVVKEDPPEILRWSTLRETQSPATSRNRRSHDSRDTMHDIKDVSSPFETDAVNQELLGQL
jgi:hypothetical protein